MFAVAYRRTMATAKPAVKDEPYAPRRNRLVKQSLDWQSRQADRKAKRLAEMDRNLAEAAVTHKLVAVTNVQIEEANNALCRWRGAPSTSRILKRISKATGIHVSEIKGPSRNAKVVFARFAAMYWLRRLSPMSLPAIGRYLGQRDHTTILHGKDQYPLRRKEMGRTLRKVW